jgi:hypothetical protein
VHSRCQHILEQTVVEFMCQPRVTLRLLFQLLVFTSQCGQELGTGAGGIV